MASANYSDITGRVIGHWSGGGGGGSQPGAARVLGPFPFAFDDVGLADGVPFYVPAVGDYLLDAWVEVAPDPNTQLPWDGTTPLGDIGYPSHGNGLFALGGAPLDMTVTVTDPADGNLAGLGGFWWSLAGGNNQGFPATVVPTRFLTTTPLCVWVSQDGSAGGAAPGASQGVGAIYLKIATPAAP